LAEVLRDPALAATKGDALVTLLGLWGVKAAGAPPDCEAPPPGFLACLAAVGTWEKLRRFDMPAALELLSPGGERRYAGLTTLTPSEATLSFVVLWRPPPGGLPVRLGARGPAADWLRDRMGRADGVGLIEPGRPYDKALWKRVVAFQQARSIEPDGVVGWETAILLQGVTRGTYEPRLSTGPPPVQ
jgi:hypothetical protein